MFGAAVTVLTFEDIYRNASPISENDQWETVKIPLPTLPYNSVWENSDGEKGLIHEGKNFYNIIKQYYRNDTLYITLKTNQDAQERFAELSGQIQQLIDISPQSSKSPLSKGLKLLHELTKVYISHSSLVWNPINRSEVLLFCIQKDSSQLLPTLSFGFITPPPEQYGHFFLLSLSGITI